MTGARAIWFLAALGALAADAAQAQTSVKVDVDLRDHDRPHITQFRTVRRFGWHSGLHYAPYADSHGRWVVGWHQGLHNDWYTIDLPVLDKVDRAGWDVFVRFGKNKNLRVRGDMNTEVETATVVSAPGAGGLTWVRPDGTVITSGAAGAGKRVIIEGWGGADLGESVTIMDAPGSTGTEVYLKQKTKALGGDKKGEPGHEAKQPAEADVARQKRDELLDQGDQRFARGLYPQAALLYQKAMKADEDDPIARFAVANSLFALGVYKTAGENIRRGLDKFPEWGLVALDLPSFYKDQPVFFQKLLELKKYVREHPDEADARLLLGYCEYFSGNRVEALEHFERLAKSPAGDKHAELFLKLAKYDLVDAKSQPKK